MKEFFARLQLGTPKFFRRLRAYGVWLMGLSAAFYGAAEGIPELHIPAIISKILSYTTLAGLVISIISSVPVENMDELQEKLKK